MQAADAILGKAGYGSVAEALVHGTRFLTLPRRDFREIPLLEAGLARHGCALRLPREDFEAGRWRAPLDALFARPAPLPAPASNGAEVLAQALLEGRHLR